MAQGSTWFPDGVKGRHVLYFMLAFFGVDFVVCSILVWLAVGTFSGAGRESAYQRGLRYNQTIEKAERQKQLGWRVAAGYDRARQEVVVTLTDFDSRPLSEQRIRAIVGRPATDRFDQELELRYAGDGRYAARLELTPGQWEVNLQIGVGRRAELFEAKERLWIPPT